MANSMRYRLKIATVSVARESGPQPLPAPVATPAAAKQIARHLVRLSDDDQEHFWIINLDSKLRMLSHSPISTGTESACLVSPAVVFRHAILAGAVSIILVHNHPSGDTTPSREDISLTRELVACSKILHVPIQDHIIVGNGSLQAISLSELGEVS